MTPGPKNIWFPAKTHGLGWSLPTCRQGWLVMSVYVLSLIAGPWLFLSANPQVEYFIAWTVGWTVALLIVCWLKGDPLKWRWGQRT